MSGELIALNDPEFLRFDLRLYFGSHCLQPCQKFGLVLVDGLAYRRRHFLAAQAVCREHHKTGYGLVYLRPFCIVEGRNVGSLRHDFLDGGGGTGPADAVRGHLRKARRHPGLGWGAGVIGHAQTCPEHAISLVPRLDTTAAARNPRVLNEAAMVSCIRCNKPLGTQKMIETMLARLAGHSMFTAPGALDRLRMCADCRVVDMMAEKDPVDIRNL